VDLGLAGRVVLVTGGSGAIGSAIASVLAEEGARVAVGYRAGLERASNAVAGIRASGGIAEAVPIDVRDSVSVSAAFTAVASTLGAVDVLVNCAGVASFAPLAEHTEEEWDRIFDTNVKGAYLCSRAALAHFAGRDGCSIVNVSSLAASTGSFEGPAYAASKAAMDSLTLSLSHELAAHGVRVNAVAPGRIETPFRRRHSGPYFDFMIEQTPLKRLGTVREVASAVAFLAAPVSAFTTGAVLTVSGGLHTVYLNHVEAEPGSSLGG